MQKLILLSWLSLSACAVKLKPSVLELQHVLLFSPLQKNFIAVPIVSQKSPPAKYLWISSELREKNIGRAKKQKQPFVTEVFEIDAALLSADFLRK